ncbi:MAG TPA: DNA-binding transcriptional regulator [Tepidisphaeraceae bacterium]|nr:DNA-binding transcriptional regulator [Tepidisphaeraceae bacterium]
MARNPKRVAISVIASTFYGRDALRGILDYYQSYANWEIHHEGGTGKVASMGSEMAILKWKAQGVLVQLTSEHLGQTIRESGIPAVDIWSEFDSGLPSVRPDDKAIGELGAQYFQSRGFRNYGWCNWSDKQDFVFRRRDAFCQEVKRLGFNCRVYEHKERGSGWVDDLSNVIRWLRSLPKPVAVMSCNDYRARGLVFACSRIGLRVPEEVAILGIDNDSLECNLCSPLLSSVIVPCRDLGYKAAALLDKMMKGGERPAKPLEIRPSGIVTRRSSDTFAVEDPEIASAVQFISDHAGELIDVSDVLSHVHISRRSLERKFAEMFNRTPREHILYTHVEQAKRLLENTTLKLSSVAQKSGFTPNQMFSRLFEQVVGLSPGEYRRRTSRHGDYTNADGNADDAARVD